MQTASLCFIISFHCRLRLALCVSSKDGYFHQEAQLNLDVLMWVTCGSATMCLCLTSHGDSLVLHSLPPSLVIKDSLDFVDILCSRSTGACQPHNFRAIAES